MNAAHYIRGRAYLPTVPRLIPWRIALLGLAFAALFGALSVGRAPIDAAETAGEAECEVGDTSPSPTAEAIRARLSADDDGGPIKL
jgi:hypothetical protein